MGTRDDRKHFDRIKLWCNRANDAWAMGEADWVKNDPATGFKGDLLSRYVEIGLLAGDTIKDIADFIENVAKLRGIDPKRHKLHGIR